MGADNVGLDAFEVVIGETHFRRLAAAQVVPDHIALFDQFMKQRAALVAFEVQRHAFFGEVESLEVSAVVIGEGDGP